MINYLTLACKHLEVDESQVVKHHINEADGGMYILVDLGIKGTPKYTLSLAELDKLVEEVNGEIDYKSMSIRDLRVIAREAKIPRYAKMKKTKLIEVLQLPK